MAMCFVGHRELHLRRRYRIADLLSLDLLTFQRGSQPHVALLEFFREAGGAAPRVHAISSISAMAQLVEAGFGVALWALVLPALSLALPEAAILARVTRASVLETLGADYVRTARAKGLTRRRVLWRHVLRNALNPMTTILGLQFAFLLAGSIVVESVFSLPGLGRLIFQGWFSSKQHHPGADAHRKNFAFPASRQL